jgi:hypothetical protein
MQKLGYSAQSNGTVIFIQMAAFERQIKAKEKVVKRKSG